MLMQELLTILCELLQHQHPGAVVAAPAATPLTY